MPIWADLNERQQHYMQAIYETDQEQEADEPFGERFYRENWQSYRELYPEVDAPAPGVE